MKSKVEPLTDDEVKKIVQAAINGRRDYIILRLLAKTGMRVGELCRIEVKDIDFKNHLIYIPVAKRDERREVPMDHVTSQLLQFYIMDKKISGKVWNITTRAVQNIVDKYAALAGLTKNVSPHSFRHYFGTNLVRHGMSEFRVMKLMGHRSVSTTMLYTHLYTSDAVEDYNKIMGAW
jgi:integrase